jgi:hypothetical protein
MEWTVYKRERPGQDGRYLISVMKDRKYGNSAFKYIAHYDAKNDTWHQYDPFEEKIGEAIRDKVTAWSEALPVFLE